MLWKSNTENFSAWRRTERNAKIEMGYE